jgi:hypothetical protein
MNKEESIKMNKQTNKENEKLKEKLTSSSTLRNILAGAT